MCWASSSIAVSVTRRWASVPSGLSDGAPGGRPGHQVTTGTSGTSSGAITESACCPSGPYMRSSTVSPGLPSPTRISASSRDSALGRRVITPSTRQGCSRPAWLAARIASYWAPSSVSTTRVSTMPRAAPPRRLRASVSASAMAPVVVSVRSIVIVASLLAPVDARLETAAGPAGPGHQRVGRRRAGGAGRVRVRLGVLGPEVLDRVEDPPGQLDLFLAGGQRRGAGKHTAGAPPRGLRAGLGERLAVGEVHVHVPDLHGRARHLGPEPHRHPF